MTAVFIVESEARRAPPAENFADFLRRLNLTVGVVCRNGVYVASLPPNWRVAVSLYDYGMQATEASKESALRAVQNLAQRLAGRHLKHGNAVIKVPPLIVPSSMSPADWVTRDGAA